MAKVSMINRELKRAKTVKKYAAKRVALKAQIRDLSLSDEERWDAQMKLQKPPRNASPCRQGRCQLTAHLQLSSVGLAQQLREAAMRGDVPGLVKSSW